MIHATVVTLIANPAKERLTPGLIGDVRKRIASAAVSGVGEDWLAEEEAVDFRFDLKDPKGLAVGVRGYLKDKPFDWAVLPAFGRKKKLLISDMDSTMIGQECIDELAASIGIGEQVAKITERAMNGELDFHEALKCRVALLAGMEAVRLEEVYRERITLMPGAETLVKTMRKSSAFTLLVSGGFTFFTQRVAEAIGFHGDAANTLEIVEDRLTGRVVPPILDKASKYEALIASAREMRLDLSETLAIGDGANDLDMLKAAGLGVGYHAKDIVRREVHAAVNHADLTAVLYLQGYRKSEFAA